MEYLQTEWIERNYYNANIVAGQGNSHWGTRRNSLLFNRQSADQLRPRFPLGVAHICTVQLENSLWGGCLTQNEPAAAYSGGFLETCLQGRLLILLEAGEGRKEVGLIQFSLPPTFSSLCPIPSGWTDELHLRKTFISHVSLLYEDITTQQRTQAAIMSWPPKSCETWCKSLSLIKPQLTNL